MKTLLWTTSDNDELIINDIKRYANFKNGIWCFCKNKNLTVTFNKKRGNVMEVLVESDTELQESLHYYAVCSIIADYGNQILMSV